MFSFGDIRAEAKKIAAKKDEEASKKKEERFEQFFQEVLDGDYISDKRRQGKISSYEFRIRSMAEEGASISQISTTLGFPSSTVAKFVSRKNIKLARSKNEDR